MLIKKHSYKCMHAFHCKCNLTAKAFQLIHRHTLWSLTRGAHQLSFLLNLNRLFVRAFIMLMFPNCLWPALMSSADLNRLNLKQFAGDEAWVLHLLQSPPPREAEMRKKRWGWGGTAWELEERSEQEWDLSLKGSLLASQPSHHFNALSCSDV